MADFIGFVLMLAALVFFPYRRVYHMLNQYVNARLLLAGIVLIVLRFVWEFALQETIKAPATSMADKLMAGEVDDALGLMLVIAGIVIILFTLWDAIFRPKNILNEDKTRQMKDGENE